MLPRHLRRVVLTSAAPAQIRALLYSRNALRPTSFRIRPAVSSSASFHSSSRRQNEQPRSPFKIFVEVLQEELRKNREWADSKKQLTGDVTQLKDSVKDSETMKKARAAYERALLAASIRDNPRLRAAAEELRKTGVKVGDAVSEALRTMEESDLMRAISRASAAVSSKIASTTEPIRNTAAYKTLSETVVDALDDSGSAKHAGYEEKELRRKRRQMRLAKAGRNSMTHVVKADPEAGSAIVLHKDSPRREAWEKLKETNPVLRSLASLKLTYEESENPVIVGMRTVTDTIGGWFEETEQARVQRCIKMMDPTFTLESFERELRAYIIPEIVDAFLSADQEALKAWCSEATYNVLWATMEVYLRQGLVSDSKILDIRSVEIAKGEMLEENIPAFVVTFATQELMLFRNAKTGEIVVGAEDRVEQCHYFAVITRVEEELDNELTGGWKFVTMGRRSARAYL
ncbi:import inner membrane translocase subunit tim44 [Laetiporus sulphureus 93-53]|uniref:Mitochondrial import inner membrane translocase subunit TIM44 n=1 Tax=Laetiporus sulphureus 93-53 TaxID=1314785 RepID=A0A165G9G8_9APHY|nr:import inner membrane translocase subunit tim44 [Laetiporus sulphureus 93-53]KZT10023.1 import inner membrane translocase subunit tim44 [Laetiporus sulphureus 93-53]